MTSESVGSPVITRTTIVARNEDLLRADLDGQVVLLSVDRGEYYGLDAIASEIWEMLAEPRSVASVCRDLVERYRVAAADCERDVLALVAELLADGSLRVCGDPARGESAVGDD